MGFKNNRKVKGMITAQMREVRNFKYTVCRKAQNTWEVLQYYLKVDND